MKRMFTIKTRDKSVNEIEGKAHKIKLDNGEVVKVFTHKNIEYKIGETSDEYWCVSDTETGLQIAGYFEYYSFIDRYGYENDEKVLLRIAKQKLDEATKDISYIDFRNARLKRVAEKYGKEEL